MPSQIAATPPGPPDVPEIADTRDRLIDGALACIARVGLAKTTLDDVAREAGCSRATLYRYFPGKSTLVAALVAREAGRLGASLAAATANCATLEDAVVAGVRTAVDTLDHHAALQFVLLVEPEVLVPHLALHRADDFLRDATALVAPALAPFLPAGRAERSAEWLVRIVLSYACSPSPTVDLHDTESVRQLVSQFVLPGLVPSTTTTIPQGVPQ
jgi:AcrR family transcriptional regulator